MTIAESPSGTTSYTYDADGNRTKKETPSELTTYEWDEAGMMIAAEPAAGEVTFKYTALGQRVEKETTAEVRQFLYDFQRLAEEHEPTGDPLREYSFGPDNTSGGWGDLVGEYDFGDDENYDHAYDAQWSTDALLDDGGTEQASYKYRAFGLVEQKTGAKDTALSFVGKQGYYSDAELDLYFLGASNNTGGGRPYDPVTGTFLTEDPIDRIDDDNLYQYVGNNPINTIDPSGAEWVTPWHPEASWDPGDILKEVAISVGASKRSSFKRRNLSTSDWLQKWNIDPVSNQAKRANWVDPFTGEKVFPKKKPGAMSGNSSSIKLSQFSPTGSLDFGIDETNKLLESWDWKGGFSGSGGVLTAYARWNVAGFYQVDFIRREEEIIESGIGHVHRGMVAALTAETIPEACQGFAYHGSGAIWDQIGPLAYPVRIVEDTRHNYFRRRYNRPSWAIVDLDIAVAEAIGKQTPLLNIPWRVREFYWAQRFGGANHGAPLETGEWEKHGAGILFEVGMVGLVTAEVVKGARANAPLRRSVVAVEAEAPAFVEAEAVLEQDAVLRAEAQIEILNEQLVAEAAAEEALSLETKSIAPRVAHVADGTASNGGIVRAGALVDGEVYVGRGGHFDGAVNAGARNINRGTSKGITVFEKDGIVYWANDSISLPMALSEAEMARVHAALQAAFPNLEIRQLTRITDALK